MPNFFLENLMGHSGGTLNDDAQWSAGSVSSKLLQVVVKFLPF